MIKEPLIAHSELTNEIYVVVGKEKYPVTEQAIKAVMATKVLDKEPSSSEEPNKSEIPTGSDDCISRAEAQTEIEMNASRYTIAKERCGMGQVEWSDQLIKVSDAVDIIRHLPPATPQEPRKGEWLRMSDLSEQEDDRYKCSRCGNVIHHKNEMNLYTFNSWCGRCGSDNGRHINYEVEE